MSKVPRSLNKGFKLILILQKARMQLLLAVEIVSLGKIHNLSNHGIIA
jgi:hypothetical protein